MRRFAWPLTPLRCSWKPNGISQAEPRASRRRARRRRRRTAGPAAAARRCTRGGAAGAGKFAKSDCASDAGRCGRKRRGARGTVQPASSRTNCAAGIGRQPVAFCPDHNGEKSPDPRRSAAARNGASAAVASGNAGAASQSGPSSRMTRLTMPRAGRPVKTLVSAVCSGRVARERLAVNRASSSLPGTAGRRCPPAPRRRPAPASPRRRVRRRCRPPR